MINKIIETFDLTKIFYLRGKNKYVKALDNVNITINKGEIFGLLGPNGAGKTTLIQILTTLLQPTSGYAIIDGNNILKSPNKVKSKVALMLESDMLYYRITGYDNLKFFCKLYRVSNYDEKIKKIANLLNIVPWLNQYVEKLSSGMKMKLALCRTLLLEREILFLDEPTLGLDVKTIALFVDIIKNLNKTIIFTSHDLSVVEKLCDRIAFINEGKIIKIGTQEEVKNLIKNEVEIEIYFDETDQNIIFELQNQDFITKVNERGNKNILVCLKERFYYKDLLKLLSNYNIIKLKEQEASLEDLFLKTYK